MSYKDTLRAYADRILRPTLNELRESIGKNSGNINVNTEQIQEIYAKTDALFAELGTVTAGYEEQLSNLRSQLSYANKSLVCNRIALKALKGEKIRIVFICEIASLWNLFKSVIDACFKDDAFEVILLSIPIRTEGENGQCIYEKNDMHKVLQGTPYNVIEGYDRQNDRWVSLDELMPDYVFFMRPYECLRNTKYYSCSLASQIAKTLYLPYGLDTMTGDIDNITKPSDFLDHLNFFFVDDPLKLSDFKEKYEKPPFNKVLYVGYPKFDGIINQSSAVCDLWKNPHDRFRIIWTPRWNTRENNCHFFDYKDILFDYAKQNSDCELMFRPHPLCFTELLGRGQLSQEEYHNILSDYDAAENASIDTAGDYQPQFYTSDLLISDESSITAEYFITGKPIILCVRETHFSKIGALLAEGMYRVENGQQLTETIDMLKSGKDPLKEKRQEIIDTYLKLPEKGAGFEIKEVIKKDFYGR